MVISVVSLCGGWLLHSVHAGVAQSVERLFCKQRVGGSSPSTSSMGSPIPLPTSSFPPFCSRADSRERPALPGVILHARLHAAIV